ncbi:MAG: TetR/AcrR family transcriptional regulator [Alphaproteobacteria bacterium]|nr:TetR/AcrR family transcriptional regulator [Alphaproteobacteria bacterium]
MIMPRPESDTKRRIEDCARRLFVQRGFAETSMRDIAQCVGVTEGALYRHFAGKEQLAWHLFSTEFVRLAETLEALQSRVGDIGAKLDAMLDAFLALFDADPILFNFLLLAQHGQLSKVTPDMPNPVEVVRRVIAEAIAKGEIAPGDPDFLAALVMGLVLQPAIFAVYGRLSRPLGTRGADIRRACRRILNLADA